MLFSEKLNLILTRLQITNIELANEIRINPSTISRFRTGKRLPKENTSIITDISKALINLTSKDDFSLICEVCNINSTDSVLVVEKVASWFNESDDYLEKKDKKGANESSVYKKESLNNFSKKLNDIINLTNMTNVKLAKEINVDPSLISRIRTGKRKPSLNSDVVHSIAEYFSRRNYKNSEKKLLANILNISYEDLIEISLEDFYQLLIDFFLKKEVKDKEDERTASLIHKLDMYTASSNDGFEEALPLENSFGQIVSSESFFGPEGFKEATQRAIYKTIDSGSGNTLYIYHNHNADWLINDSSYYEKWVSLMKKALANNNKIIIFQDVYRDVDDIIKSLSIWFPLYVSGRVKILFINKEKQDSFVNDFIVVDNLCAINPGFIINGSNYTEYIYTEDKKRICLLMAQIKKLLQTATSMMNTFFHGHYQTYCKVLEAIDEIDADASLLVSSFPVAVIPKEVYEEILSRHNLSIDEKKDLLTYHELRVNVFLNLLKRNRKITYYCSLPSEKQLKSAHIKVDLPFGNEEFYYLPEEIFKVCNNLLSLEEKYPNFKFHAIKAIPFKTVKIVAKHNECAYVVRTEAPYVSFSFNQKEVAHYFEKYIETVGKKSLRTIKTGAFGKLLN